MSSYIHINRDTAVAFWRNIYQKYGFAYSNVSDSMKGALRKSFVNHFKKSLYTRIPTSSQLLNKLRTITSNRNDTSSAVDILPDPPKIIGLVGRSRCGKDSTAEYIRSLYQHRCNYTIVRLSAPVKDAAKALYHFSWDQLEGSKKDVLDERWNITPRSVFQKITSDIMSNMGAEHFTKLLYERFSKGDFGEYIIIPDIRYLHDIDEVRRHGGKVFLVQRDNIPVTYECEDHLDHLEEYNLPIINNNGINIDEFHEEIKSVFVRDIEG